ncbi:glycosyltransferase family 2 protein [Zwartia sp.]|uniref:glycosyltransferase family 2 protein n=1 Tax=Zwartia sp. TaxID=2978004 RepID=UPI003BB1E8A8
MLNAPIAFIIFNRPRHTRQSFEAIRAQRPSKLLIIADGPRPGHPTDFDRCRETREVVANIDWPCEVLRHYSDDNMGCKLRVSSGLDWVFSQVERAIILEDDCIPHEDFFSYCDALLDRYENDSRVWVITGNNFQHGKKQGDASYYFSKFNHCWGWATWRRAWKHYRVDIPFWPEWGSTADWRRKLPDPVERTVWSGLLDRVKRGEIDTWDYQWTACVWYHGGLTATPNVNLVTNIGFGPDATHTVTSGDEEGLPIYPLGELIHPQKVKQNVSADRHVFNHNFGGLNHPDRFMNRLKKRRDQFLRSPQWIVKKFRQVFNRQA